MPFSQDMCLDFATAFMLGSRCEGLVDDELTWQFLKGHFCEI